MSLDFAPLADADARPHAPDRWRDGPAPDDALKPLPAPDGAEPPAAHPKLGPWSARWAYHGADGVLQGYVCRFDPPGSAKELRPLRHGRLRGRDGWHWKGWGDGRPLYRPAGLAAAVDPGSVADADAEAAAPADLPTVLVVEGEKAADAAASLLPEYAVVSPMNGALSPGRTDWSPVAGRRVAVWPDNDEAGAKFARAVARLALEAGARSARIVAVPDGAPDRWDLADPLPEGWTEATLRAALREAEPFDPHCERQGGFLVRHARRGDKPPGVFAVGGDGEEQWFCSRLDVLAETRDERGEAWGRLLGVHTKDGALHRWAMPMRMLAGDGTAYRERLLDLGLTLGHFRGARDLLAEYVQAWRPGRRARCVERVGWQGGAFVLPDAIFGGQAGEEFVFQSPGAPPGFATAGTLEGWREEVAAPAVGNSRLALSVALAFAGPLAHLTGEESGGFHLSGGSSTGKTTALRCAASAWGVPVHTWRATDNAAEALAHGASDALLCLDEVSQADGRAVDAIAYMLGNGAGKARMRRDASARPAITWRVLFLSTGETGLAAKMAEAGRRARAGQEVRVVELPADAGAGLGLFEGLHGSASGDALSRHLRLAPERHKGHAARAFLRALAGGPRDAAEAVAEARDAWIGRHLPAGADGQVSRVARRFGLVAAAGELAGELGVLPWPEGEAERAAARCFADWLRARGGAGPAELREGLAQVRAFLEAHGSSRFEAAWPRECYPGALSDETADAIRRTINRAGFRRLEDEGRGERWEFYVLPESWKAEVCKGLDAGAVARAMAERGWIRRGEGRNVAGRVRIPGHGPTRVYVVTADFLSAPDEPAVPLKPAVF